jgi:hypothetical protein
VKVQPQTLALGTVVNLDTFKGFFVQSDVATWAVQFFSSLNPRAFFSQKYGHESSLARIAYGPFGRKPGLFREYASTAILDGAV